MSRSEVLPFDHAQFIPSGMHSYSLPYDHAQFIPSGMHQFKSRAAGYMQVSPAYERAVTGLGDTIARELVDSGIPMRHAERLIARATARALAASGVGGLSDDAVSGPTLEDVQAKAGDFQNAHKTLIARLGAAQTDAERQVIRDTVEGIYNDWTAWAVAAKGGLAPYQWDRANPVDAIMIAIRDDLRNTADLLAANKAQQVLGKQIQSYGGGFKFPGLDVDIPWYVWLGGTLVGGAIVWSKLK